jgi:large subunit ribosomal protein L10
MPNAKVLSEKQAVVAALTERLKSASSGVLVDYKGITVDEDTALRTEMRKNGIEYSVVKNTLVKFAINNAGYEQLDPVLSGTTSMATSSGDPIAPFRILSDYSKKLNDKFNIKAAFMDGQVLTADEIEDAGQPSLQGSSYLRRSRHHAGPHHQPRRRSRPDRSKKGGEAEAPLSKLPRKHPQSSRRRIIRPQLTNIYWRKFHYG